MKAEVQQEQTRVLLEKPVAYSERSLRMEIDRVPAVAFVFDLELRGALEPAAAYAIEALEPELVPGLGFE